MAYREFDTKPRHFLGDSSDVKPNIGTEGVGCTFYEADTGKKFIWDGFYWADDLSMIYAVKTALEEAS